MPKVKMTGKQVRKAIKRDDEQRFNRERLRFFAWWQSQQNREQMSLLKAAWEAWKERAGIKHCEPQPEGSK